jgi:hypothetical protein
MARTERAAARSNTSERIGNGASSRRTVSRSAKTGRYIVTNGEARAAAKTKVIVDKKLGKTTPAWVRDLANEQ